MTADAPSSTSEDTLVGQTVLGRYRVIDTIARGGMGRIYRAEQIELKRMVALKVLADTTEDPEGFRKRFTREAATSARLSHPNIVIVHDYGTFEQQGTQRYFMALELIEGRTLGQIVKQDGPLAPGRAAWVAHEIARALREAHRQGVVHRDLKPSNVMIVSKGEGDHVKVLDFGIAKVVEHGEEEITREGAFVGTPRYMSPEQLSGGTVDARSDLFSLGVLVYQMLTGKPPHASKDLMQALVAHVNEPPPELPEPFFSSTPDPLRAVIRRAMQREPRDRFQDASELLRALDAAAEGLEGWSAPVRLSMSTSMEVSASGESATPSYTGPSRTGPRRAPAPAVPDEAPTTASPVRSTGSHAAQPGLPAPSSRFVPIVAVVVGALVLAIVVWRVGLSGSAATPAPPTNVVGTPSPSVVTPPSPPPATPLERTTFQLVVESDPPGATVLRDGETLGTAPVSVPLELAALRERPVLVSVELEGYAPYQFSQGPSATDVTVRAPLVALPRRAPPTTRTRRGSGTPEPTPPPQDRMLKTRR